MKKKKIYEGKTKKVYEGEHETELILEFKDDAVALSGSKPTHIRGKGMMNKQISVYLFRLLESYHIGTHLVRELSDKEILVKRLNMIPVVVMVHNVVAGKLVKSYGMKEGKELECPIIEYYLKDEERDDPMINEDHVVSFGHATSLEIKEMHRLASKSNAVLKAFLRRREFQLVDLRLEFGRHQNRLLLADEISLNTVRTIDLRYPELGILDGDNPRVAENLAQVKSRIFSA
ncbi:MAG TPA: phosphoribosylaminoimidazolesuccinocarboxamide synthase [bacterium]|nr:phosphoribosylaminoimidazolesuccinocarboxamide synthase [bacterium]HOY44529.1 phosphoribosylaminoimidazolesuccinocarboxamide synthase [bacterium]HPG82228.1 phosphoribosylaminoimidazolesuccinocarboxamide synthase [bacterium]HPM58518.1 phosphoribosylaminoimidazolesuccinocarboxamide synthase [bacterium]